MIERWIMLAAAVTLLLGCAGATADGVGSTKKNLECRKTDCDPVAIKQDCVLFLCTWTVANDPIDVYAKKVKLTWTTPKDYVFCTGLGDGVFLKYDQTDEFEQDPDNQIDPGKCKDSFKLKDKNEHAGPYEYKVLFRSTKDPKTQLSIDPSIVYL